MPGSEVLGAAKEEDALEQSDRKVSQAVKPSAAHTKGDAKKGRGIAAPIEVFSERWLPGDVDLGGRASCRRVRGLQPRDNPVTSAGSTVRVPSPLMGAAVSEARHAQQPFILGGFLIQSIIASGQGGHTSACSRASRHPQNSGGGSSGLNIGAGVSRWHQRRQLNAHCRSRRLQLPSTQPAGVQNITCGAQALAWAM